MVKFLLQFRKKFSNYVKLLRLRPKIRKLYNKTYTNHSKPFKEVWNDLWGLMKSGLASRNCLIQYFQFHLQYKGARIEDYVFYNEWFSQAEPVRIWAKDECRILASKADTTKHLSLHEIRHPKCYGILTKEETGFLCINGTEVTDLTDLLKHEKNLFVKPSDGMQGKGCFSLQYVNDTTCLANGKQLDFSELADLLETGYIVEESVKNHPDIDKIYPLSLNTLRMITMRDTEGKCHFIAGIHRFGANGNRVDNTHQGGLAIGINAETGEYKEIAYYNDPTKATDRHPDTGFVFQGNKIPFFKEAVALAIKAHESLPRLQAIGWDIAITPTGPLVIEGNHNFSFEGIQARVLPLRHHFNSMLVPYSKAVQEGNLPWSGCK